jgi:hypothetical protein
MIIVGWCYDNEHLRAYINGLNELNRRADLFLYLLLIKKTTNSR